ncbi:MAG: hypothetical protein QG577_727 [Thermodesulfobacteriota bacterium]|nr:hypothetical protein [Thermodesulfobacteriota bacterium]
MGRHSTYAEKTSLAVLALFAGVLLLDPFIPGAWENLAFLLVAIASAWLLTEKATPGRYLTLFLICAFPAVVCGALLLPETLLDSMRRPIGLTLLIMTLLLLGYSIHLLLGALWRATVVTKGQIVSTVNLYLSLGMFWAYLYAVVTCFDPHSFDLPTTGDEALSNLIYFSFVTLASLGYGDIVPQTPFAQRLAIAEAIMGQFYTAILVAYLLSIYLGTRHRESDPLDGKGRDNKDDQCSQP